MLSRSLLPPSSAAQIAACALADQNQWGAISQISRQYDVHRQTVYDIRQAGYDALIGAFSPPQPIPWTPMVPDADIDRAIVALYVTSPTSTHDIEELLPIILGTTRSHGYICNIIHRAEHNALNILDEIDLSACKATAIDEMFWHRIPLLTAIDLDSGYLLSCEKVRHRSGPEWVARLQALKDKKLEPDVVIKDSGKGMAHAVPVVWPHAEVRDDCFHAVYETKKVRRLLENRAYRHIASEGKALKDFAAAKTTQERCALLSEFVEKRDKMNCAIERFDAFNLCSVEIERLLSLCDRGSGELRSSQEIRDGLPAVAAQITALGGKRLVKLGRYLSGRAKGLASHLDSLHQRLAVVRDAAGGEAVVRAAIRAYQANLLVGRGGPQWDRAARKQELAEATAELRRVCIDDAGLMRACGLIFPILQSRHRASSAIENLHSTLRPYIALQKGAHQGFLDLYRFYWNMRKRRWGRHKGTSALEVMTGEKVKDWLTMLGFPPSDSFH